MHIYIKASYLSYPQCSAFMMNNFPYFKKLLYNHCQNDQKDKTDKCLKNITSIKEYCHFA